MILLDSLQNPPIKTPLLQKLISPKFPNFQAITPNAAQKIQQENKALSEFLGMQRVRPFSFSTETFYYLLSKLSLQYKIALALSASPLLYYAYLSHPNKEDFIPLIPDKKSGKLDLKTAKDKGANCFILPYLNEDILTLNACFDDFFEERDFVVWDISYALSLGLPLPKRANIFLANGENLGLMRPFGILASQKSDFYGLGETYLEIENLYEVFLEAIQSQENLKEDYAKEFFECLKSHIQDSCYLFYPTPKNTLALGLKGNRARDLIQSLIFDEIQLINGAECLYGFLRPSFVLQLMGYTETQARELLSLSFYDKKADLKKIAYKIAQKYQQLQRLKEE